MGAPPEKVVLAVDLGTTSLKVALVSVQGRVLGCESLDTGAILLPGGGAEQCPADWWSGIVAAAHKLLGRGLCRVEQVTAICCSTHFSGTVAVDRGGHPLCNAIIWMDARGAPYARHATRGFPSVKGYGLRNLLTWVRLTGGIPSHAGKDSIAHVLFLKHERPDLYAQTHKFLEAMDYLDLLMTGRCAATHASISLHWATDNRDLSCLRYSPTLLSMLGVNRDKLPDLLPPATVLGPLRPEVARELGLREDVVVVKGTPDPLAAALGSGAVRDYAGHIYVGTSSWVTCHVPFKKTDLAHNMASLPSAIPGRYFVANEQESAGKCLAYLADNVFFHADRLLTPPKPPDWLSLFDAMAQEVPAGSDKLLFTPWLYGERTPVEDRALRSSFFNQSLRTTRPHMVRAVMEGVALNLKWAFSHVERFVGRRMDDLAMVGGGANSDVWCQIHADVLDRTIRQVKDPVNVPVRGAAFLAAMALGHLTLADLPGRVEVARTYRPNAANRAIYNELFSEFLRFHQRNRDGHARLNGG
jgi:xylulokinase